ncbi:MAG: family deacetylase [Segetibacter sp.]|nr:family deacetylase [Segetibacter sp.]
MYMQLKKLNVLGSVLYIAAHPDDENNTLLPYLAKEKLYRTGYLSITRGDGGQNLIGNEQGIELGLIRTQELLAARRLDGAEQFFSRAYEFGFSKSADEALRIWGKDKILSDVVWIIRQYQPDVIIKRFPPDKRAGHGHHAASAILADEAFTAAADPNRFPEQFKYGVKPWQAKRIFWNTFNFGGGNNTTSDDQLKINVGVLNPLIGKSYGEIGGEARSMHKSQGTGSGRRRGPLYEYFTTTGGDTPHTDLMDGIVTSWDRVNGGSNIQLMLNQLIKNYDFEKPEQSVPALVSLYNAIKALPESNWRNRKLIETQAVIEACTGLFAEAVTQQETAVQGDSLKISMNFNNRSNSRALLKRLSLISSDAIMQQRLAQVKPDNTSNVFFFAASSKSAMLDSSVQITLSANQNVSIDYTFKVDDQARLSQPYWLEKPMKQGYFDVENPLYIGEAQNKPNYIAKFTIQIEGQDFEVERPLQNKFTDPVKGEMYEPLTIIPKVTVSISPTIVLTGVIPATNPSLFVNYVSNINAEKVPVTLTLQNGSGTDALKNVPIDFKRGVGGSIPVKVKDVFYKGQKNYIEPVLALNVKGKEQRFSQNIRTIKYDHIPYLNYFYADNLRVVEAEIKTVGKKLGYIIGAGDKVPDALTAMGYDVKFLHEADLNDAALQQFDAIIVGVRAHNIYEYLSNRNDVLNRYVENGGNLIVQYMKSNQVGSKRINVGPYPFSISVGSRVTEENAKVNLLLPKHPAFNYPNKITGNDFEGWVQERSTYQVDQSDEHYEKLISMNDTGEKEGNGSLVITKYGKGNFAYVSLVLFRQLPAGVPGAYRLMANLIALPKNK